MDVHKTTGHRHHHHDHKKHSPTLCCSIPKIWMAIQNILATDNKQAWQALSQDSDRIVHVKNALLMSRVSNDASLLPASSRHKVLQFEQSRRAAAHVMFGRTATDLNALQVAMFHRNEALACQIVSFLRLHADPRELNSFLNHVWGNKNTSLHLACFLAMPRLVKLLMELGASPATVNARKLTPADCCKDPECLAKLALPPPQPMVPVVVAKKSAPVAVVSTARSPSSYSSSTNNSKRPSLASPTTTTARQAKPAPAKSLVVKAPALPAAVALDTPPPAPHTDVVTLPTEADPVAASRVQSESPSPSPPVPAPEPEVSLQHLAPLPSVTVDHGLAPEKVPRAETPPPMQSSVPSQLGFPLLLPPPPSMHEQNTAAEACDPRPGLDPTTTATVQPQPQPRDQHQQQHDTISTLCTGTMLVTEVPSKSAIVPAVKDPSDSVLFHVAAFHLRQVVKGLGSHQQHHHPRAGMLQTCHYSSTATMATLANGHVYREQEAPVL